MVNLALIGLGQWGKNYLTTIKQFPHCRIKYICSNTLKRFNSSDDYIATTNFKELLKYKDIDGIIIATPGSTHFQIAEEFLKRGFNLLIEKPLTTDYKAALRLKALNNKAAAKVLVGHIYLFDPAYLQMKKLLKEIGTLQYVSYEAINNGPFRSDMSVLWELGPHAISLLLDIYGQYPTSIKAWAQKYLRPGTDLFDTVNIKVEFPNHCPSFVNLSWLSPIKRRELTVVSTSSALVYNDLQPNRLTFFEGMGPSLKGKEVIKRDPIIKYPSYNRKLPLEAELGEFINAISKNQTVKRSGLDFGVKVTQLLSLAERSISRNGEAINVE